MRCEEFESRINEVLDERARPHADAGVADHAGECAACADVLASYRQVLDVVHGAAPLEMDADPTARIVAEVQLAARRRRRLWMTLVPLAVAASLLIALAPAIQMRLDRNEVEVASSQKSESVAPFVAPRQVDPLVADAQLPAPPPDDPQGTEIVRMAFEVNDALAGLRARLSKTPAEDESRGPVVDDDPEERKWVRNMSDGLKPLVDTMAAALIAMGRTLPDTGAAAPPSS